MKKISHGGNIYKKAKEMGIQEEDILDFSANISPLGLPEHIRRAMIEAIDGTINYPDPDCSRLKEAISKQDNVPESHITCGNGGADLLYRLAFGLHPKKVLLPAPAFVEYEEALSAAGAQMEYYLMRDDFVIKEDILEQITEETDFVVICNPNNPTGILTEKELNEHLSLTSANSINVARFLPQAFYYFYAYAQLKRAGKADNAVICVPSGNFGNITAGLFGKKMGLPVKRFIAANNRNDIFYQYLQTGKYNPRPSIATIANAMDVGDPSNFARVLDLYSGSHADISAEISGTTYTDEQIRETVKETWKEHHYLLDPHGACGYRALVEGLKEGETGVFLETAHPAKFLETVESIIGEAVEIPAKLQEFMKGEKKSLQMTKDFADFKKYLLTL